MGENKHICRYFKQTMIIPDPLLRTTPQECSVPQTDLGVGSPWLSSKYTLMEATVLAVKNCLLSSDRMRISRNRDRRV